MNFKQEYLHFSDSILGQKKKFCAFDWTAEKNPAWFLTYKGNLNAPGLYASDVTYTRWPTAVISLS